MKKKLVKRRIDYSSIPFEGFFGSLRLARFNEISGIFEDFYGFYKILKIPRDFLGS